MQAVAVEATQQCPSCRLMQRFNQPLCRDCLHEKTSLEASRLRGAITLALVLLDSSEPDRRTAIQVLRKAKEMSARAS